MKQLPFSDAKKSRQYLVIFFCYIYFLACSVHIRRSMPLQKLDAKKLCTEIEVVRKNNRPMSLIRDSAMS